jgi:hypothetical protein
MFAAFLFKNKNLIIIGLFVVALLGQLTYITLLNAEKLTLEAEKTTLTLLLDQSQANLLQLKNNIQAQNAANERLKTDGDARLAKNAVEVKQAQAIAKTYKQKADALLNAASPQGVSTCDAANELINQEIKNANK